MRFWVLVFLVVGLVALTPRAKAQIQVPGTNLTVTPVNGGTGTLTSVPIPGGSGLSVTVGTGSAALPLQGINNNPNAVNITTWDDWYNEVPLGFNFPFFGENFTTSWAATNGYVTFVDPSVSGLGGGCCSGVNLSTTTDPRYNYTIYGMHTDLYSWNGQNQYYLKDGNSMTYGWYNLSQCCSSQGGNSFEIKINSSGLIDTRIAGAMVSWNSVTSGFAGDLSKGQYYQYYHGQGLNITPGSSSIFSWQALNGTGGVDLCLTNPLSSPACPGYEAAYLSQQCSISALYNPACPGYTAAYFTQQCTTNPLYDVNCPGYASAYLNYQCSINALYSTTCPGYEQAYFNQQCELNGLYSTQCPNYSTAYATAEALKPKATETTTTTTTTTTSASSDGTPKVALVADSNVNNVITSTSTSTAPTAPAAPVQLVQAAPAPTAPTAPVVEAKVESKQEAKTEEKKSDSNTSAASSSTASTTDSKPSEGAKPTARQEIQARRQEAARASAVERGKNLANDMGKAADMESQKQIQNVVIQAMGFTPGFDAYGKAIVPDAVGYKPYTVYNNQRTIDNRSALRMFGGSDRLHNEMVESQYGK